MKRVEKSLLVAVLLFLASHTMAMSGIRHDSIQLWASNVDSAGNKYPKHAGHWYMGTGYSVPFMFGDMSSLTERRSFWGNKVSLKGGYSFSSLFGLEIGFSVGRMRGFSPRSAENFRLGTEDAMTYYPYTILGGKDNYQPAPDNVGIWENQGNNIYIKSIPYSQVYSESRYWETSLQAVFNFNRLFVHVQEGRETFVSLLMKPGVYLQKFYAQAHSVGNKRRVAPEQHPLSIGLGGDIAIHFALTQKLGLEVSSGLVWVSKRGFDGIRTIRRSHDDFIWQNGVSLFWKFNRKAPKSCYMPSVKEITPITTIAANPFSNENFAFDYIVPDLNVRKERSVSRQAHIHFPVSRWDILPELGDNLEELGKITTAFRELADDSDVSITSISVDGYASPEGPHNFNTQLSQNRAKAISSYISRSFKYPEHSILTQGHAEDWDGLKRLLQTWENPDRDRALNIIQTETDLTARQKKLAGLAAYKTMLNELYPLLRRNEYTFYYTIVPYTIERATKLINTHPEKLSVEEMIAVANRYPIYSDAFNECAGIAFKFYPESPIAHIYMAAIALHKNDTVTAADFLSPISEDIRAWNLLGVCAALNNNLKEASHYFQMAAETGDKTAAKNLDKLKKN